MQPPTRLAHDQTRRRRVERDILHPHESLTVLPFHVVQDIRPVLQQRVSMDSDNEAGPAPTMGDGNPCEPFRLGE